MNKYADTPQNNISNSKIYHDLPQFDLSNLDEDHEILMEYDSKGNLVRVRKVRRIGINFSIGTLAYILFEVLAIVVLIVLLK